MSDERDKAEDLHLADIKAAMTTAVSTAIDDVETREYSHADSETWIRKVCEVTLEKLQGHRRACKYVVTCTIARNMAPKEAREREKEKDGKDKMAEKQVSVASAGLHLCTSCYYGQQDGVFSMKSDAATKMHIVTTVFWCSF